MANRKYNLSNGCIKWVLDTSTVLALGAPAEHTVGQWAIQVVPTGAGGAFVPKQCVRGSGLSGANLATCVYYESDGETAIAAGTATSAAGIYYIPSDGLDTSLDFTADTGSMALYIYPIKG